MNYSSIFSISAAAERLTVRALGFSIWAIALTALGFVNGCKNSYELGRDLRAWWEQSGRDWALAELAPCVAVVEAVIAWAFGVERCWSAQQLPITLAANAAWWAEVAGEYRATAGRIVGFVDNYLMGV